VDPDPNGHDACDDWDGDGIANAHEIISNPFVADYPRIVTRITTPITMEIRISETSEEENFTQTVTDSDVKETLSNSMESKHYTMANRKTTPYVTRESLSTEGKHAEAFGYQNASANKFATNHSLAGGGGGNTYNFSASFGLETENSRSSSQNVSMENSFGRSTMSEKTVFEDVDYTDNLDRNGIDFRSDTVETLSKNYRESKQLKRNELIGPNAGVVRAGLYVKNVTVNMPVRVSNVRCTLSFRTPGGQFLPVKTFMLRNDDYSDFKADVYGGQELGPYTIEIANLNTREVRVALANAYIPQIHVVSYDMERVPDSNYNPGVDNLAIVEETAKARTATIKIIGSGLREIYRVAAFDVEDPTRDRSAITPGVSLKKALYNILHDRVGNGEMWEIDDNGVPLTVPDDGLRWKPGSLDPDRHAYTENTRGNSWNRFETYVKTYVGRFNEIHHIETIRRIDMLTKYNPFNVEDNEAYNPNELLSVEEIKKMKFWVVLHNGRYYEGDLNDPIWAGERYEIVLMDMRDFNEHFESFAYTPFQSGDRVFLDTRWNSLTEEQGPFARSIYLGKALPNDVIQLEVALLESRFLFNEESSALGFGQPEQVEGRSYYYNFDYRFQREEPLGEGILGDFEHEVEGRANSIRVTIERSVNAHHYGVIYYPQGEPEAAITKSVTQRELDERGGIYYIIEGGPGIPGARDGLPYVVEVRAHGVLHNTPVAIMSSSGGQIAVVTAPSDLPAPFEFAASGAVNQIHVRLPSVEAAAYFMVRHRGPLNYLDDPPTLGAVAYPGFNSIMPERPDFEVLDARDFETGIFLVQASAYNENGERQSATPWTYVEVDFDRYLKQRQFAPKVSDALHDLEAVDLEVNFNDGSGWFRLQVMDPLQTGVVQGPDRSRIIDCFYSSYMEQNDQKFFVNLMPPHGQYEGVPNVFFGGRTETEVYIRTIQKPKYRDSFWMAPTFDDDGMPMSYGSLSEAPRSLSSATVPFACTQDADCESGSWCQLDTCVPLDMTENWLAVGTDASTIEASLGMLSGNGTVSTSSLDDYFFSPKEQRFYSLRASVSNEIQIVEGYRPDRPGMTVALGVDEEDIDNPYAEYWDAPSVRVADINSDHSSVYEVYYVGGTINTADLYRDATVDPDGLWVDSVEWIGVTTATPRENFATLVDLELKATYTICVAARNRYGLSIPNCEGVTIPRRPGEFAPLVEQVTVQGCPSLEPHCVGVDIMTDGFLITGIEAPNAVSYTLYYKDDRLTSNDVDESPPWTAVEVVGTSIKVPIAAEEWTNYRVRIFGFNEDGVRGADGSGEEEATYYEAVITPQVELIELADARNIEGRSGLAGYFRPSEYNLVNWGGVPLRDPDHFRYEEACPHLFDRQRSGYLDSGTSLRLVTGGHNVVSDLGLTPIAKNLATIEYPPAGVVYIDPMRGRFSLPGKPVFWSRMEDPGQFSNAEYTYEEYEPSSRASAWGSGSYGTTGGKFGNGSRTYVNEANSLLQTHYFPFGERVVDLPQGTVSFWFAGTASAYPSAHQMCGAEFVIGDVTVGYWTSDGTAVKKDGVVVDSHAEDLRGNGWHHMRVSWDTEANIEEEPSVNVYLDGREVLGAAVSIDTTEGVPFEFRAEARAAIPGLVITDVDNLKIWDHVMRGATDFEWYGGVGIEGALHPLYKAQNGHRPRLVADPEDPTNSGGVGYYLPDF
jgi:hypothetical protein